MANPPTPEQYTTGDGHTLRVRLRGPNGQGNRHHERGRDQRGRRIGGVDPVSPRRRWNAYWSTCAPSCG